MGWECIWLRLKPDSQANHMELWALLPIGAYLLGKLVENYVHQGLLEKIPLRIHVNGTRGKSQTTEFLTYGLQAAGIKAMGKVTGVVPFLIHTDGTRTKIKRISPASIREQRRVVYQAVHEEAQALVLECMAVKPELQRVSEQRLICSQIGVITNVRSDHTDVLGKSEEAIASALTGTIPSHGALFTSEQLHLTPLIKAAEKRGTTIVRVSVSDQIDSALKKRIPSWIHSENLALALAVCQHIGVSRECALQGMLNTLQGSGSFRIIRLSGERKRLLFVNAFSGNDPSSTRILLEKTISYLGRTGPFVGLFNHRQDRFFRAQAFASFVEVVAFDRLFLIGDHLHPARRLFPGATDLSAIHRAGSLCERLLQEVEDGSTVFGFGNIAGIGLELNEYLRRVGEEI